MKYHKILFATDLSAGSDAAFEYATALARDSGALLLIVHVEEFPVAYAAGEMVTMPVDFPNPVLREVLERVVPSDKSIRYEHRLMLGNPAELIVRLAAEQHVDLIVIGTHGRTGLSRVLMGSVAESVLRHAKCPVLAVKSASKPPTKDDA